MQGRKYQIKTVVLNDAGDQIAEAVHEVAEEGIERKGLLVEVLKLQSGKILRDMFPGRYAAGL